MMSVIQGREMRKPPLMIFLILGCSGEWGVTGGDLQKNTPEDNEKEIIVISDGHDGQMDQTDVQKPKDIQIKDLKQDEWVEEEIPDQIKPKLISAFSTDGVTVTARFSEVLAKEGAENIENFEIKGSDGSSIKVQSAEQNGIFVKLGIPQKSINPSLTYTLWVNTKVTDQAGNPIDPAFRSAKITRSVYLAIVWHQHQPTYVDVGQDEEMSPWVRKHAVKDYYDMAAILEKYPNVHVTINLTPVLLNQLITYYLERLGPYVDVEKNQVDAQAFLAKWKGHTDKWIDLLLEPTPDPQGIKGPKPTKRQLEALYDSPWSCLSASSAVMNFFPEYLALREKPGVEYTYEDFLLLKIMFEIAWFDPDFLNGPVTLPDGLVVDLTDVVKKTPDGKYYLKVPPSEALANRLVAEEYKIMKNVIPIHKKLRFDPKKCANNGECHGQIEISTTPYYHPILPLIWHTDLAKESQPSDPMPTPAFSYPKDANAHVAKAVRFYEKLFDARPLGMWPGEGSVAEAVVQAFVNNGILWIATGQEVLEMTLDKKMGQKIPPCAHCQPYRLDVDNANGDGGDQSDEMAIVFRDVGLSDAIGFGYYTFEGPVAATSFLQMIQKMAPPFGGQDRLIVVILDGENAWEHFQKDLDAKSFFNSLYNALDQGYTYGEIVPVTVAEYILGNKSRNIPPHPVHDMKELEPLWAGSWIKADFSTWIGDAEENTAWGGQYLSLVRKTLESNLPSAPNPLSDPPTNKDSLEWFVYNAYEEMYAAEGSDWFWWYGPDNETPAHDDTPFDQGFRSHLTGVYKYMNFALEKMGKPKIAVPDFKPIIQPKGKIPTDPMTKPPVIDGVFSPNETEWENEGGFFNDNDSGAMANPDDHISRVYYGFTKDTFYCAPVFNIDLTKKAGSDFGVGIFLSQKHITDPTTGQYQQNPANKSDKWGGALDFQTAGAAWMIWVDFSQKPPKVSLYAADGNGAYKLTQGVIQMGGPTASGKILEFAIPFSTIGIAYGDPLEFMVMTGTNSKGIDRAPNTGGVLVFEDPTVLVFVTFEVDVSGEKVPLESFGQIVNKPKPDGKGIVYIAGNHPSLGMKGKDWIPNKVSLNDSGQAGDAVPNDKKWSGTFKFMPGFKVEYKYTIGVPTDEGKWVGTEEFPVTYRGFKVTTDPNCKKMKIHDVFANKAPGGKDGEIGSLSVLEPCLK